MAGCRRQAGTGGRGDYGEPCRITGADSAASEEWGGLYFGYSGAESVLDGFQNPCKIAHQDARRHTQGHSARRKRDSMKGEIIMRGKKPSEREKYMLRADIGTFVEVTREVCLEWHRAGRRERYQMEKKRAHGVCSLETQGENIRPAIPGGYWENTPEENAIRSACMEKLRESLARLPEQDARLSGCSFLRK